MDKKPSIHFFSAIVLAVVLFAFTGGYFLRARLILNRYGAIGPYRGERLSYLGKLDETVKNFPEKLLDDNKNRLAALEKILKSNPGDYDAWLEAGVLKKFFNNYEGARDAWEYAKLVAPGVSVAYINLANLYADYLKNLPYAEYNYLGAIARDAKVFPNYYVALADFYENYPEYPKEKAESILLRGITEIPFAVSLRARLGHHYLSRGDEASAIKYFEEALSLDPSLIQIREELERLKSGA